MTRTSRAHNYRRLRWINLALILAMVVSLFPWQLTLPGPLPDLGPETASAHNLDAGVVYVYFDENTQKMIDDRILGLDPCFPSYTPPDPILKGPGLCEDGITAHPGDDLGLIIKAVPDNGTETGVGGYSTYYVPNGVQVIDAAYVLPGSDPSDGIDGYDKVAMKGQAQMPAVGAGGESTVSLVGFGPPDIGYGPKTNILGQTSNYVTAGNTNLGTLPGVYGDSGIFYSTDPSTAYGSYTGGTLKNNSGDTVGWRTVLGTPLNEWDAWQMAAYGIAGTTNPAYPSSPRIDSNGRGYAPWGLANAVAGPQSGYAWEFDGDAYAGGVLTTAPTTANVTAAIDVGPWQRIQYPGSLFADDPPGNNPPVQPYVSGTDASSVGYDFDTNNDGVSDNPMPTTVSQTDATSVKAVRWAFGQLSYLKPEFAWVKIRVHDYNAILDNTGCPVWTVDTFGGDAGGDSGGKDHIWRYYDPNSVTFNGCLAIGKPATKDIVKVGDTFQYKIKLYNMGDVALTNVVIRDTLPSGVQFISSVPAQNTGPNPLVWNVGPMLPGDYFEATVTVKASSSGVLNNTITATGDPPSGPPITTTTNEKVVSGSISLLKQTKTVEPAAIAPGGVVTYTINIDNIGSGPSGSPVVVTEYLPDNFTYNGFVSAQINGANVTTPDINSTNPSEPVFTVAQAINAGYSLIIKFTAISDPEIPVDANLASAEVDPYCNSFKSFQDDLNLTTGALACVKVGGSSIGDTIWRDWNGDGVQDTGEEGMPGVTVQAYTGACDGGGNPTGASAGSDVTDADGNYLINGLLQGDYCVIMPSAGSGGVPAGYGLTSDPDGGAATTYYTATLLENQERTDVDFGYQPGGSGSIGDLLFEDVGNDGGFDVGTDKPITDTVTVWLYEDSNGNGQIDVGDTKIMTATTNPADGTYSFTGLAEGLDYIVQVDESDPDLAAYFNPNSFANTTGALQAVPNLSGSYTAADFGYFALLPSSIGDEVCIDSNNDGSCAGETLLPGVTVQLYKDGSPFKTTTTNITGTYSFEGLGPGNYTVIVDAADPDIPGGYFPSANNIPVTLGVGEDRTDIDFPFVQLISKQVDKVKVDDIGETLTYTINVAYPGSELLSNVVVTDTVPAGTTYAGNDSPPAASKPTVGGTGTVQWNLGSNTVGVAGQKTGGSGVITHVASSTASVRGGTSLSPAKPAGTAADDLLIAGVAVNGGSDVTITPPPGWILIRRTDNGKDIGEAVYYKVAGASEPATYNWTVSPSSKWSIGISAYRGVDTTAPINADAAQANPSSTSAVAPSVTTTVAGAMLVGIFVSKAGSTAGHSADPPAGMTERYDVNTQDGGGNEAGLESATAIFAGPGATGTRTATLLSASLNVGHLIALKPLPGGPSTTTTLSAAPTLVSDGNQIQVSMVLTATGVVTQVTASDPITLAATNMSAAGITCGAPSPSTPQTVISTTATIFTYNCSVDTGSVSALPASAVFTATANGFSGGEFAEATSNSVLFAPPLTFQVLVDQPATVDPVVNSAWIKSASIIPPTESDPVETAITDSIGDFVWADLDGQGDQDAGEPGLSGVEVCAYDGATQIACDTTDANGAYRIYGLDGTTDYTVKPTPATLPANYLPTTASSLTVTAAQRAAATVPGYYSDADFGLRPPGGGSIGDTVWLDANEDGVIDGGETLLPNITVELYDATGTNLLDTAVTDASGFYTFTGLYAGDYVVQVDETSPVDSPYNGMTTLAAAMEIVDGGSNPLAVNVPTDTSVVTTADFPYNWTGSIGDYVWYDTNYNGVQDESPVTPIAGAAVLLYHDANNNGIIDGLEWDVIGVAITDANGAYTFDNLPPGNYLVDVYEDSITDDGVRDIVPTTPNVLDVTLAPAEDYVTADFGYYQGALVEGHVFWDKDRNSLLELGDEELGNIQVTVTCVGDDGDFGTGDDFTASMDTSDPGGYYKFIIPSGYDCRIEYSTGDPDIPGTLGDPTTPISFDFTPIGGEDEHLVFDFGLDNTGSVGDLIYNDADEDGVRDTGEPGLAGVTVNLYDSGGATLLDTTVTGPDGSYLFEGLEDGSYVVKVDETTLPASFGQTGDPDEPGVPCTTCDGEGTATVSGGGADLSEDFGYAYQPGAAATVSVTGTVFDDNGNSGGTPGDGVLNGAEPGLPGVDVSLVYTLSGGTPTVVLTTVDANGLYTVTGIPTGSDVAIYVLDATLPSPAYQPTSPEPLLIPAIAVDTTDQDFGFEQDLGSISGRICEGSGSGQCDPGDPGVAGITVTLTYAGDDGILGTGDDAVITTTTSITGFYTFTGLEPGLYDIGKSNPSGYDSLADADGGNPDSITKMGSTFALGVGEDAVNRDFELEAQTGLIGDLVWHDLDGDGLQDGGEPGLVGIVVNLLDSGGGFVISTTTDANGIYTFTAPPGDYIVEFEPPTGYEITLQDEGGDDSVDSDADPVTGRTGVITLTASAVIDDVDAGLYQPVTIGDFIFLDPNANGIQDPGETNGVPGVPITLTNLATGALYNTISDGSGAYTFTVPPGSYAVSMPAALSGLVRTSPSPATATLSSGQSDLTLDFGYISPTAVMLASFSAETTAGGVILRWSTSAERDQEGFIVWRAVGETGPYQAVSELILATNAPDGASYTWIDADAGAGAFWYKLQSLPDGEFFGPIPTREDPGSGGRHRAFLPIIAR